MDALQFSCQRGCTKCCEVEGYVYVTDEDITRAAAFLGIVAEEFERRYVRRARGHARLRRASTRPCLFLAEDGCRIHPAKPTQCQLFPFWPELVEDEARWQGTAIMCPGIGTGRLYQIGTAMEIAAEMRRAFPATYAAE